MQAPFQRAAALGLLALTLSCGKDSTGPSAPSLAAYAGTWAGTTSQSRTFAMWVGNGVIDSVRVQVRVTIISGLSSCLVTYVPTAVTIAADRTFHVSLDSPSMITGSLTGSFTSTTAANGTFQAGWNGTVICGSSITFGTGGNSASGTWTATKS